MKDNKRQIRYIVGLSIGERMYRIHQTTYVVEARFCASPNGILLRSRMENLLGKESAHLTIQGLYDTIEAESAIGSAGKEEYADQSEETNGSRHHRALLSTLP